MSRFFKSAAFPILIVVVLAFFAVKLVNPGSSQHRTHSYQTLVAKEMPSRAKFTVEFKNKGKSLEVKLKNKEKYEVGYIDQAAPELIKELRTDGVAYNVESEKSSALLSLLTYMIPFVLFFGFWIFLMNQVQGGGSKVMSFGKSRAKRTVGRLAEDHLPRRRRRRRGGRGAARDQGVPREPEEVPGARRADSDRRAAVRAAGHRQDAARARRRRRGRRAVLLDLGLGLRRDVRRRRRLARARPVRAGQAEQPVHHLHGRDRRRRAPPRRRPGRRSRRARADAQPAARRDGRLRGEGQHHHDRGHQPARHPRPGAAASRPLRPPDRRRPPRPQGPREDPRGPHARQAAGEGDRHRRARRPDARLHRRRPVEPDQRGRAAGGAHGQARNRPGRARGGDHARDRRPREEDARDERERAPDHRLPRDGPRDRRALPRALRPGPQDLGDLARPGARLHDLDAPGGSLPDDPRGARRTRWR